MDKGTLHRSKTRFRGFEVAFGYTRDVTYVAANMRDSDWEELSCLLPPEWTRRDAGLYCLQSSSDLYVFVAKVHGQSIAAFGFSPITPNCKVRSAWMFGTNLLPRYINLIGAFMVTQVIPELIEQGLSRIEARAMVNDDVIHGFFENMGADRAGPMRDFGGPEKDFYLYSWNVSDMHHTHSKVCEKYKRFTDRYPIVHRDEAWYFEDVTEGAT